MAFAKPGVYFPLNQNAIVRLHDKTPAEIEGVYTEGIETCLIFVFSDKKTKTSIAHVMVNSVNIEALIEEIKWLDSPDILFNIYGNQKFYPTAEGFKAKLDELLGPKFATALKAASIKPFEYNYFMIMHPYHLVQRNDEALTVGKEVTVAGPELTPYRSYNKAVNDLNVFFNHSPKMGMEFDGENSLLVALDPKAKLICDEANKISSALSTRAEKGKAIATWIIDNLSCYDNLCFKSLQKRFDNEATDKLIASMTGAAFHSPMNYLIGLTNTLLTYLEQDKAIAITSAKFSTTVLTAMTAEATSSDKEIAAARSL